MIDARNRLLACAFAGLTSLAPGCMEKFDPVTEVVYEGRNLVVRAEPGRQMCAATGPSMDRFVDSLLATFELGSLDERLDVVWVSRETFEESPCGDGGLGGCALPESRLIIVKFLPFLHELVHGVGSDRLGGRRHNSFFWEGLAVAFEEPHRGRRGNTDVREALEQAHDLDGDHYGTAGQFVGLMIDEFGAPEVVRFIGDLGAGDRSASETLFEERFGESLDAFIARYEAENAACGTNMAHHILACDQEPVPWLDDLLWSHNFEVDCSDDDTIGMAGDAYPEGFVGYDDASRYYTGVTIDVPRAMMAGVGVSPFYGSTGPGGAVEIFRCDRCGPRLGVPSPGGGLTYPFEQDRYYVRIASGDLDPGDFQDVVVIAPAPE